MTDRVVVICEKDDKLLVTRSENGIWGLPTVYVDDVLTLEDLNKAEKEAAPETVEPAKAAVEEPAVESPESTNEVGKK